MLRLERPCVLNCPLPKTPYETEPGKDTFAKSQPLVIYGVKFRDYFANRVAKCRVGGGVASAASHRSGRAQLRHPARLVMASPVCSAIRGRCGDPQPRFRTLDGFPTHESMTNPSLPSTGSPQVRFPGFTGTMKECDSLPSVSPRFVSFAWRYHPVRLCSSLPQVRRRLGAWSFRVWQPPANFYRGGADRVSQVPGRPPCACALFLDPGRTSPPGHPGGSARPPHLPTTRAPTISLFRGSIAEPRHSLFTLRRGCCHPRRKTRFRVLAKLSRTGLVTRWASTKGFRSASVPLFLLSRAS